jgi:hypothetical protein
MDDLSVSATVELPSPSYWLDSGGHRTPMRHRSFHALMVCNLMVCLLVAVPVKADDVNPTNERKTRAELPWRDLDNRLVPYVSKHTDSRGRARATIVFLLRDQNGRGLAVGVPGSEPLRIYFETRLELEIGRLRASRDLQPAQLEKLHAAADLDIVRFMRKVQLIDRQLSALDYETAGPVANRLVAPLHAVCEKGLFDESSLYSHVLSTLAVD